MSDVTVEALRRKVDEFLDIKAEIKALDLQVSQLNKTLIPIQTELNDIMEAMELTRFEGSKGKINRVKIDYVSMPATDEARAEFFDYLKAEGLFEEMASVHFQKLNSFYKDRLEMSIELGEPLHIPGLEPKQRVEIRKGR